MLQDLESKRVLIDVKGFLLADPVTFLTDSALALLCFYLARKLSSVYDDKHTRHASWFFIFLGLSTMIGGFSHLLDEYTGKGPHLLAWIINGVSVAFAQSGAVLLLRSNKMQQLMMGVIFIQFIGFVLVVLNTHDFFWVKANSFFGLIAVVTVIHFLNYRRNREFVYLALPLAIATMTLPLMTHNFDLEFNELINKNVISHILLLPCIYALFLAYKSIAEHHTTEV